MDIATILDQQLRAAGIPIVGVAVGNPIDRSTWRVQYGPGVTEAQKAQAAGIIRDLAADATSVATAGLASRLQSDKLFRATVIWIAGLVGKTPQQAKTEITAIYKQLP